MNNKTVLYYTSNSESPDFELKIIDNIKKQAGNLPIISVSQKPIDLGKNICVGDVGLSYLNEFRQMYLGALEAKTPYIIVAESDFLYPPEYFSFVPEKSNQCYRYNNIYLVYDSSDQNFFYRKKESEGAQIFDRELFIKKCEEFFEGMPEWFREGKNGAMPFRRREPLAYVEKNFFGGENPCLTFKTGNGVSWVAHLQRGSETTDIPYWGNIIDVKKRYLNI